MAYWDIRATIIGEWVWDILDQDPMTEVTDMVVAAVEEEEAEAADFNRGVPEVLKVPHFPITCQVSAKRKMYNCHKDKK